MKVCVVGQKKAGKSCFVRRAVLNKFYDRLLDEHNVSVYNKNFIGVEMEIWDPSTSEQQNTVLQGSQAIIIVYDASQLVYSATTVDLLQYLQLELDHLKKTIVPRPLLVVVGTKSDLYPCLHLQDIVRWCDEKMVRHFLVSARFDDIYAVCRVFRYIATTRNKTCCAIV